MVVTAHYSSRCIHYAALVQRTTQQVQIVETLQTKLLLHCTLLGYTAFLVHAGLATHVTQGVRAHSYVTPNSPSDSPERRCEREGSGEGECPDLPEVALERGGGGLGVTRVWRLSLEVTEPLEVLDSLPPGDCAGRSAPARRPKRLNVRLLGERRKASTLSLLPKTWGCLDLTDAVKMVGTKRERHREKERDTETERERDRQRQRHRERELELEKIILQGLKFRFSQIPNKKYLLSY